MNKNAQSDTGDHEVHNLNVANECLPDPANRLDLGDHPNCQSAVTEAKQHFERLQRVQVLRTPVPHDLNEAARKSGSVEPVRARSR